MCFLSVVALMGQETLIVRSWNEYCGSDRPALAKGVLIFGTRVVVGAALLTAAIVALAWSAWPNAASPPLVLAASAFLFMHSLMQFHGQFARVAAGVIIGELPRELMWRLIVVVAIGGYGLMGIGFGATEFFLCAAAALSAAVLFQFARVLPVIPAAVRQAKPERDVRAWARRSFNMWLSALLDTTGQYLEVVVVGLFLGPVGAALFFVATRITNVFAMISGSTSVYAMPQISGLFYRNSHRELQRILRSLAIIGAVLVAPALAVIIVGGKWLLWAFGPSYVSAYPALVVLAIGAAVGALVGPAAHVLLLTGHERVYPRIMAAGLTLRFLLIAVLGPTFGSIGAAVAWSATTVLMAAALVIACRRMVGLDPSLSLAFARPPPN
jgi:O-antigen/teichoic acid export membrane protein